MTKSHTFPSDLKMQHMQVPQTPPSYPQKGDAKPRGFSNRLRVHTDAVQVLHSPPSIPLPTRQVWHETSMSQVWPGGSSPVRRAVLTPPWGQPSSPSSSHPLPGAGSGALLTPCWNSSACRNQQETNHFPDPDLAACPGAGVPEPAQHRSQDCVAAKGEGGGGWDQPCAGLHQHRLPGNLIPIWCCWALVQKSGQSVSAYLTSVARKCSWVPALKTLHVNTLC